MKRLMGLVTMCIYSLIISSADAGDHTITLTPTDEALATWIASKDPVAKTVDAYLKKVIDAWLKTVVRLKETEDGKDFLAKYNSLSPTNKMVVDTLLSQ